MEDAIIAIVTFLQKVDFNKVMLVFGAGVLFFWLTVVWWVWNDARKRFQSSIIPLIFAALTLFLFVFGYLAYMVIRPKDTLEDVYWTEREKEFLLHEIGEYDVCPKCHFENIFPEFLNCPNCGFKLKYACQRCNFALTKFWKHCPKCGTKNPRYKEVKISEEEKPAEIRFGEYEKKAKLIKEKAKEEPKTDRSEDFPVLSTPPKEDPSEKKGSKEIKEISKEKINGKKGRKKIELWRVGPGIKSTLSRVRIGLTGFFSGIGEKVVKIFQRGPWKTRKGSDEVIAQEGKDDKAGTSIKAGTGDVKDGAKKLLRKKRKKKRKRKKKK